MWWVNRYSKSAQHGFITHSILLFAEDAHDLRALLCASELLLLTCLGPSEPGIPANRPAAVAEIIRAPPNRALERPAASSLSRIRQLPDLSTRLASRSSWTLCFSRVVVMMKCDYRFDKSAIVEP